MKILFQGDSITDGGRNRSDFHSLGGGYPKFAAEALRDIYNDVSFYFINKAVSGDETPQLRERWQRDAVELEPDIDTAIGVVERITTAIMDNNSYFFITLQGDSKTYWYRAELSNIEVFMELELGDEVQFGYEIVEDTPLVQEIKILKKAELDLKE